MRMPAVFKNAGLLFVLLWLAFFSIEAQAAIDNAGVLDNVLNRYSAAASGWAGFITARATWLFWTLAVISMVWTFGFMALRKADIGEFYAEFIRFTIFTGFFWWLLTNGPNFATDIMSSLRTIAGSASGTGSTLTPSGIVDIGFDIFFKVLDQSSVWSPVDSAAGILISAAILIILALIGVNMLLLLVSGWILAYAGVFFLGFGGSRWTSDMAINYYKTVLNIAAQLFTMVLLVGIGKSFVDQYYNAMSAGISLKELGVMMIVAVVLLALVNKLPAMVGGLAMGGGTHALGGRWRASPHGGLQQSVCGIQRGRRRWWHGRHDGRRRYGRCRPWRRQLWRWQRLRGHGHRQQLGQQLGRRLKWLKWLGRWLRWWCLRRRQLGRQEQRAGRRGQGLGRWRGTWCRREGRRRRQGRRF